MNAISMNFSVLMISGLVALTTAISTNPAKKMISARINRFLFSLIQLKKLTRSIFDRTTRLIAKRIISAVTCEARSLRRS